MFSEDALFKEINVLSGGEKVRLALCKIFKCSLDDLTNDEKMCFDILQSIVKSRYLSYGYSDDTYCVSKVADGWIAYFVDKGEIFNLKKN